jgi:membrane-bound lytic murein transglycosylase B
MSHRVGVLAAVIGVAGILVLGGCSALSSAEPEQPTGPIEAPPVAIPTRDNDFALTQYVDITKMVDAGWAATVAKRTGIPERAVLAYGGAVVFVENQNDTCHLGWNTLAGIGELESHHGTIDGSSIGTDGRVTPPILGIPLDGKNVNEIPDTDQGAIDGDAKWDRAVGPLQFIPDSWRNWGIDGSGDGVVDPQNFDDATLATANYLCKAGGDLSVADNWRTAIASYNDAVPYGRGVSDAAIRYARDAAQ